MTDLLSWPGPGLWTGVELVHDSTFITTLSDQHVVEIKAAVEQTKARELAIEDISQTDFPLSGFGMVLQDLLDELMNGRGFALIRGLPVERWSRDNVARAYWGIGSWLGDAVSQNAEGHLLGHVTDLRVQKQPSRRIYQTAQHQPFHSDSCDVVGLLCLRSARSGGLSSIASAASVHNHLLEHHPQQLRTLYGRFYCDRFGEVPAGKDAAYPVSIFNRYAGYLTCCGMDPDIRSAQRLPQVPRMTAAQQAALDTMQKVAQDLSFGMALWPGDIQFLHNHTVLHARTHFEDHPEPERRRHLLRLWLSVQSGRPLPSFLAERWGTVSVGAIRGGILVAGATPCVSLAP